MNKRSKQFSFINIGLSSLLVIFLVLCLTTFSLLSLSSAKSDYSQSRKLADHRSDYYSASSEAEITVSRIDSVLEDISAGYGSSNYKATLEKELEGLSADIVSLTLETSSDGNLEISFEIPIDDRQSLAVKLRVTDPAFENSYYEIAQWQITNTADRNIDDTVQLMPVK